MTDQDQEKELTKSKAVRGHLAPKESVTSTQIEVADFEQLAKELQETHNQGVKGHYKNKDLWSYFIMGALTVNLLLQWVVVFLVGWNVFDFNFRDYDLFLPALFINTLAQIVTLALVVVKGLFDTDESPPRRRKSFPRRRNRARASG